MSLWVTPKIGWHSQSDQLGVLFCFWRVDTSRIQKGLSHSWSDIRWYEATETLESLSLVLISLWITSKIGRAKSDTSWLGLWMCHVGLAKTYKKKHSKSVRPTWCALFWRSLRDSWKLMKGTLGVYYSLISSDIWSRMSRACLSVESVNLENICKKASQAVGPTWHF